MPEVRAISPLRYIATRPSSTSRAALSQFLFPPEKAAVKKALEKIEGVKEANADFETGEVLVRLSGEVSDEALTAAGVAEEYEVLGVSDGE